ncbi:DUF6153 family protein [Streptomyces sp. SCSIO 30461]|uniref:DUF6153 family protein n=1 Tax=Streptomyces sp. SCSIO 30461 TaxID=3118085 RepID=UPI0030D2DA73
MATQKALTGAMRWARGAVIVLCAALAVLVHHEIAAIALTSAPSATHTGHSMPEMAPSSADAMPMGSATVHTHVPGASQSAHSSPHGACDSLGMQHCATVNADAVKLPVPPQDHAGPSTDPDRADARPVSAAAIGRAPPDLSVLSQLRI